MKLSLLLLQVLLSLSPIAFGELIQVSNSLEYPLYYPCIVCQRAMGRWLNLTGNWENSTQQLPTKGLCPSIDDSAMTIKKCIQFEHGNCTVWDEVPDAFQPESTNTSVPSKFLQTFKRKYQIHSTRHFKYFRTGGCSRHHHNMIRSIFYHINSHQL